MKKLTWLTVFMGMLLHVHSQSQIQNKVGGVCFRVDDHQGAIKWRDWNAVFNKYNQKFSLAINASRLFNDTAAVNALKEIVASGHELMDHTPDHHMGYFSVKVITDTNLYSGNSTVDHINSTKICLKVDPPYTGTFVGEGNVNLIGNKLISLNNGEFNGINGNPYYALIYLPSRNQYALYTSVQNKVTTDPDTLVLQTYWGETWKNDTAYNINYQRITTTDVKSNPQSNILLAQRSIQLFTSFGLPAPKTWIQPGGSYALLNRAEVASFANVVGYRTGAVNILSAQKCYNEVDSFNNRRFSLQGPDFYEESNTYQGLINIISDRSARHYNSFGLSHMSNVVGGWTVFLGRVDSVLNWCVNNNIPIRTYQQWGSILFDSIPNSAVNILPALNKDLNNNNFPDGYNSSTTFDLTDGIPLSGNKCFAASSNNAVLASISNLGGLEKGNNLVSIYTKGQVGDSIRMIITYPEMALPSQFIMFGANTVGWTLQSKIVNIPAQISRINVSWVVLKRTIAGPVKMCALEMRSSSIPVLNKTYLQSKKMTESFVNINLDNWVTDGYFPKSTLVFGMGTNNNFTYQLNNQTHEVSVQTNRRFFVGRDSVKIWVSNPDGMSDTAWFKFESTAYQLNYGDTLNAQITLNPLPTTSTWNSVPMDSFLNVSLPNFTAKPKSSTWYILQAVQNSISFSDSFYVTVVGSAPIDTTNTDTIIPQDTIIITPPPVIVYDGFANKVGGVCFRIDDHQGAVNWRALNTTFNKYGKKFTLGINASKLIGDTASVNALKEIVASGHELADHTPDHNMTYFNVNVVQDTNVFRYNAGVDHFYGKKVCLKIDSVITTNYTSEGLVNVNGSILITQNNGEWKDMGAPIYYSNIYLPYFGKTYCYSNLLNKNQNDPDTMTLQSYWGEPINLGMVNGIAYHRLTQYDIKHTMAALQLMLNRTNYILDSFGLPRPKTFLQPSGNYCMMSRAEVKNFFGNANGFTAGGVYISPSLKYYNEVDANSDKRFGMHGPDFKEENTTAKSIMATISDNSAKHQNSFGLSMMSGMTGGLSGYVARLDSLLQWLDANKLPVLSFNKWANILYDSIPNPFVNVIPNLQQDLNKNGIPDGYTAPFSVFDTTDGVLLSNNISYSKNSNGVMTAIQNLGGIEKGNNLFYISTKGFTGDSVRIAMSYPELGSTNINLMVPANTANWNQNTLVINIPTTVSKVNFTFYAVKRNIAGNIKISGMQMLAGSTQKLVGVPVIRDEVKTIEANKTILSVPISNQNNESFLVYPNPFEQQIIVAGKNTFPIQSVKMYDLFGKEVTCSFTENDDKTMVQLYDAKKGFYVLEIKTSDGKIHVQKLIKN